MSEKDNFNPDSSPSKLGSTGVRRANTVPIRIFGGIVMVGFLVVLAIAIPRQNWSLMAEAPAILPSKDTEALSLPEPPELESNPPVGALPAVERAAVNSSGFCDGYEIFCSTTTTDKPAETLQKLATAMPQGNDKHYRVVVSVVVESPPKE